MHIHAIYMLLPAAKICKFAKVLARVWSLPDGFWKIYSEHVASILYTTGCTISTKGGTESEITHTHKYVVHNITIQPVRCWLFVLKTNLLCTDGVVRDAIYSHISPPPPPPTESKIFSHNLHTVCAPHRNVHYWLKKSSNYYSACSYKMQRYTPNTNINSHSYMWFRFYTFLHENLVLFHGVLHMKSGGMFLIKCHLIIFYTAKYNEVI